MSILSYTDLNKIVRFDEEQWREEGDILIKNGSDKCFTPMSYDLRVGGFYRTLIKPPHLVYLKNKPECKRKVIIKPGDIALIGTFEEIKMPKNGAISALIVSKVSQVSRGLSNVSTKVDPGWSDGQLLIPIQNISKDTIELSYQDKFCTIIFINNQSYSDKIYSSSSRDTVVNLFAQTQRDSFRKEQLIILLSAFFSVGLFGIIGYMIFGNSAGFIGFISMEIFIHSFLLPLIQKQIK